MTTELPPLLPLPMGGVPRPALADWVRANMRAAIAAHDLRWLKNEAAKAQPVSVISLPNTPASEQDVTDVEAMAEYLIHGEFRPEIGLWVSLPAKNAQAAAMLRSQAARILELLEANGQLAVTLDECQALVAECRAMLKQ